MFDNLITKYFDFKEKKVEFEIKKFFFNRIDEYSTKVLQFSIKKLYFNLTKKKLLSK